MSAGRQVVQISLEGPIRQGGTAGFISWGRLEEQLRKAGELRPGERMVQAEFDAQGLRYYVETDPAPARPW